jgi:hypothetical protein
LCIVLINPAGYHLVIGRGSKKPTDQHQKKLKFITGTTTMKTLIASTVIALSLFATAVGAQPYDSTSNGPQWAQKAFAGIDK